MNEFKGGCKEWIKFWKNIDVFFPFHNLSSLSAALPHFFLASADTMKQKKKRIKGKRIKDRKGRGSPPTPRRGPEGERGGRRVSIWVPPFSSRNLGGEEAKGIRKPRPAGNSKYRELAALPSGYSSRPLEISWTGCCPERSLKKADHGVPG